MDKIKELSPEEFSINILQLESKIKIFDSLIDNIMIFGGEPLDQNQDELIHMLFDLKSLNKNIWIFTRYKLNEIPKEIKYLCDYIKTGRYISELSYMQYGINLATKNQKIFKRGIDY